MYIYICIYMYVYIRSVGCDRVFSSLLHVKDYIKRVV